MNLNKLFSKAAFLLLLTVSLVGCDTDTNTNTGVDATGQTEENIDVGVGEEVETDSELETAQGEENVTTEDVAEDADDLIGQTVTIRSNAIAQIEPATFTVADQEYYSGDIVVVNATGTPFVLPAEDDTEIQITGEVTEFVIADIESAYDLDLDPDLYIEYSDRPAIIAESLAIAPEPGEITEDPAQYYGETLAVTGEIETVYGENTFTIDEEELLGADNLLVVVTNPTEAPIIDGETVAVTGELRQFVIADLETDYDLTWDLDIQQELEVEYSDRPVLVVEQVYPSAIPSIPGAAK